MLAVKNAAVARRYGKMHQTYRLARRGAAGAGDAGDGDGEIDAGTLQRADRHLRGGFLADGAKGRKRSGIHPEHRALGVIGIGDEAAVDDVGRTGNIGQCTGDEAPGAGLGRGNGQFAHPAEIEQRAGQGAGVAAAHLNRPSLCRTRGGGWWRWQSPRSLPRGR